MIVIKKLLLALLLLLFGPTAYCWGFYAHRQINYYAVFLLPPEMLVLYKPNINFIAEHAVDPDKRRYAVAGEAPRHYIDIDKYGPDAFAVLPQRWDSAISKFTADTLNAHGIVPWWIQTMLQRLTAAFREKNQAKILKLSAEIGHYIADAHVPLHASSNHNGQLTDQVGIHGFWESRLPELLAEKDWDFFIGKAAYLQNPTAFIWKRVAESAAAADTVLLSEKKLSNQYGSDQRFAFEERNGILVRQYSGAYARAYNTVLLGMVERRMRQSVYAVASFWYTAWVNAGQPDLKILSNKNFTAEEIREFEEMNLQWRNNPVGNYGHQHE
ncbi:MAG: zinc dependent phospholipase C family protein [Chitinophagaceae bacterium]